MDGKPELSIVVTVLNEEGTVDELYERTVAAVDGRPFELLVVDDGSSDHTFDGSRASTSAIRASAPSASRATSASTRRCTPASRAPAARSS